MASTKTSVVGYFNPNSYPLQLSLAEFNLVLSLQPKAYVVDRSGRLVNDPILDRFVGKGKLARASDQKQTLDITYMRPVNDTSTEVKPTHQHSVSQAKRFDTKDGRVVAVESTASVAQPTTPPPQSYNPVRGLTIEEAKRLNLIRPTKVVPEDFGIDETAGAPRSGQEIPLIKYATDSTQGRKPAPLPSELVSPSTPQQQAIIAGLQKSANLNPDNPNILSQVTREVVLPKPTLVESVPAPAKLAPPPIPTNPVPTQMTQLPPPVLDDLDSGMVVEEELEESSGTSTEEYIQQEDRVDASRKIDPPESVDNFDCGDCVDKAYANYGLLLRHVRRYHPGREAVLMAPYRE